MGMYENLNDIVKLLYHDEELLRLLYYPPTNFSNIPDPLDPSLQDMIDLDADWKIRLDRIMKTSKSDDLETNEICRIYVYAGRREPTKNYHVADQEVVVDVLCHNDFENGDLRSLRISDRVNELLVLERVTGMGKMDYVGGNPINAPSNYSAFRHHYKFGSTKK